MNPSLIRLFLAAAVALHWFAAPAWSQCQNDTPAMAHMEEAAIALQSGDGRRVELNAHIADDPAERAAGYQHICPQTIERTAILFWYDRPVVGRFHMHNVHAPLDIGFFDADGVLIQAMHMHPYSDGEEVLYGPMQAFQYALEARPGFFREHNLAAGEAKLLLLGN